MRSRSDVIGTVGTGEVAEAGVAAVGGPGRGRGNSRRGVSPPGKWSRGPAGAKAIVDIGRCSTSCCCCTPAYWVEMRSQDGFTVGGIGEPDGAGADAGWPVGSTESLP